MTHGICGYTQSLSASNDYQQIVMDWLRDIRKAIVVDRRGEMDYDKDKGIDLEINDHAAQFKADSIINTTGNVALELISNLGHGTVGCGAKRDAQWWLYYDTVACVLHVIDHHKLIDRIQLSGASSWRGFTTRTSGSRQKVLYATLGMLIPLSVVKNLLSDGGYKAFDLTGYIEARRNSAPSLL